MGIMGLRLQMVMLAATWFIVLGAGVIGLSVSDAPGPLALVLLGITIALGTPMLALWRKYKKECKHCIGRSHR